MLFAWIGLSGPKGSAEAMGYDVTGPAFRPIHDFVTAISSWLSRIHTFIGRPEPLVLTPDGGIFDWPKGPLKDQKSWKAVNIFNASGVSQWTFF